MAGEIIVVQGIACIKLCEGLARPIRMPGKSMMTYSNLDWHHYYVKRFNKSENPDAAYMAMLFLFYYLAFGNEVRPA